MLHHAYKCRPDPVVIVAQLIYSEQSDHDPNAKCPSSTIQVSKVCSLLQDTDTVCSFDPSVAPASSRWIPPKWSAHRHVRWRVAETLQDEESCYPGRDPENT